MAVYNRVSKDFTRATGKSAIKYSIKDLSSFHFTGTLPTHGNECYVWGSDMFVNRKAVLGSKPAYSPRPDGCVVNA